MEALAAPPQLQRMLLMYWLFPTCSLLRICLAPLPVLVVLQKRLPEVLRRLWRRHRHLVSLLVQGLGCVKR